jgi:LysW-gamma-L-lysine carboxypeptidase
MTRAEAVGLVHGLVAIPSLSKQESQAVTWLVDRMQELGYDRAFVDEAGNAVGELGARDAARVVVLLGHIDTVPGDIPVRIDPQPEGGVLFGRGSVDAKGSLATCVAAGARLGSAWAWETGIRVVVVGAVEEEAATSKGARFIADRFDGRREPIPSACVIGEPSGWRRVTLGYKGRLLLDLDAEQPTAHTAGPEPGMAEVVVEIWNWVRRHADAFNTGVERPFERLGPSLRRFVTSNAGGFTDTADAQMAWRLPLDFDTDALVSDLVGWAASHIEAEAAPPLARLECGERGSDRITLQGRRTTLSLTFRGFERAWRSDRGTALVRSFLSAIRQVSPAAQPGFVVKTGTSDMNVVAPTWRCPIVAYGPGDSALDHTPDEHLGLDEYWTAVQVLDAALRALAGEDERGSA